MSKETSLEKFQERQFSLFWAQLILPTRPQIPRTSWIVARKIIAMEMIQTTKLPDFTQRELDVVRLIAKTYTRQRVADTLGISYNTVDSYMHSIFKKVGLHRQIELIAFAQENGYDTR